MSTKHDEVKQPWSEENPTGYVIHSLKPRSGQGADLHPIEMRYLVGANYIYTMLDKYAGKDDEFSKKEYNNYKRNLVELTLSYQTWLESMQNQ